MLAGSSEDSELILMFVKRRHLTELPTTTNKVICLSIMIIIDAKLVSPTILIILVS